MTPTTEFNTLTYEDDDIVRLPRLKIGPLNARVWLDGTGAINIELEGGGYITIGETDSPDFF